MIRPKRAVVFGAFAAAVFLSAAAPPASARIACNRSHVCWHVRASYVFRPEFGVVLHPDSWHWRKGAHFHWREHAGRGYWHKGVWILF